MGKKQFQSGLSALTRKPGSSLEDEILTGKSSETVPPENIPPKKLDGGKSSADAEKGASGERKKTDSTTDSPQEEKGKGPVNNRVYADIEDYFVKPEASNEKLQTMNVHASHLRGFKLLATIHGSNINTIIYNVLQEFYDKYELEKLVREMERRSKRK